MPQPQAPVGGDKTTEADGERPAAHATATHGHAAMTTIPATPETLDDTVETTTTRGWIALVAITLTVVAVGLWAFVATIPQQTSSVAVVDQPGDTFDVTTGRGGSVVVKVAPGDRVDQGQTVAALTPAGAGSDGATSPLPVTSPAAGTVGDILVRDGEGVDATRSILTVERDEDGSEVDVVTFLPAEEASLYRVGKDVAVTVDDLDGGAGDALDARVTRVARVPSPLAAIQAVVPLDALARQLDDEAGGVAFRVDLSLVGDSPDDGSHRAVQGQVVEVTNTYDEQHPIDLLFGGS